MKTNFSQKFKQDKFIGIHLFIEVEPGKYLVYLNKDTGLLEVPFLESSVHDDLSLRLVGYLYHIGLSLRGYRELTSNTNLEYSFIDNTVGVAHENKCFVVAVDKTDRPISMQYGSRPISMSLNEMQEYFREYAYATSVVDAGLAQLITGERIHSQPPFMKVMAPPDYLLGFYEAAVLPQFGIESAMVDWGERVKIGPDEYCCDFRIEEQEYGLIYEDYQGLGKDPVYIENNLGLQKGQYDFVEPISETAISPSYGGFRLPTPYKYVDGVTGTFTILRVHSEEEQGSDDEPKETYRRNTGGMVSVDESRSDDELFLGNGFMPYGHSLYILALFIQKIRRTLSH